MKYAQINFDTLQMSGKVQNLPTRWTTPEGVTINNFNQLPRAALYGLGWVPVIYETISNPETHKHSLAPVYDEDNKQFVFPAVARDIDLLKTESCAAIDQAASDASARYITVGAGQEARYLLKQQQALLCQTILADEGDPTKQCPMIVQEAAATGQTVEQTAQTIVDQAAAWLAVAAQIEAARIGGKQAVQTATDNVAVIIERDAALAELEAI
jgi:hypothetical protein